MKIFLSYASDDAEFADQLAHRLGSDGHEAFFDRESLVAGEGYDRRIREAIGGCDLFLMLLSADALQPGSYALSELDIAERRWKRAAGHVLPVALGALDYDRLPPYLAAVTVLRPAGDPVADIVAAVGRLQRQRRGRQFAAALTTAAALTVAGLAWWLPVRPTVEPSLSSPPAPTPALPAQRAQVADPVRLNGMPTNSGWLLHFDIVSAEPVKEVFYRWGGEAEFRSTGHQPFRSPQTGLPMPRLSVEASANDAGSASRRELQVKFTDANEASHGPYALGFDPQAQSIAWARQVLEQTAESWLTFREYPAGRRLLYFTHLLSVKNGLSEIRYSVDDASLARRVRFKPDEAGLGAPRVSPDDEVYVEIPMAAAYVEVQLVFADGTESPRRRFKVTSG